MPEMRFHGQGPDETVTACYSPSRVIKDFFRVGETYPIADFVKRSRDALTIASERVKQKYGFYCTSAQQQLSEIEQNAARFAELTEAKVTVLRFVE